MYICQVTGKYSRQGRPGPLDKDGNPTHIPGEKLNKIVVATRERIYTKWIRNDDKAESLSPELILNQSNDRKWLEVFVGRGWEIVREINASDEGLALWNSWSPEEREVFLQHLDS